jgi:hypothetical protein
MSLLSAVKRIPDIGHELILFLGRPRDYVRLIKGDEGDRVVAAREVMGWCIATALLILSLYKLCFGSVTEELQQALGMKRDPSYVNEQSHAQQKPSIAGIEWKVGFGVGMSAPEAQSKGLDVPQVVIFNLGALDVALDNVVPDHLADASIAALLTMLYALLSALCVHFPARLLGGTGAIYQSYGLAIRYYSFVLLTGSVVVALVAGVLLHVFALTGASLYVCWILLVVMPMAILSVRCFFAVFSEHYGISKKRLFAAGLGSIPLSSAVAPVVLVPLLLILLKAEPLLKVIL